MCVILPNNIFYHILLVIYFSPSNVWKAANILRPDFQLVSLILRNHNIQKYILTILVLVIYVFVQQAKLMSKITNLSGTNMLCKENYKGSHCDYTKFI